MAVTTRLAPQRMRIGAELVEATSGDTLEILNPATAEVLTTTPAGGAEDVDRAVRAARHAFEEGPWPRMERSERAKLLNRFADRIEERMADLFRLETLNNGRPVRETRAQVDAAGGMVPLQRRVAAGRAHGRDPDARALSQLPAAPSDRRLRPAHSVQPPADDPREELGPRACDRQYRRGETLRADSADDAGARRDRG